MSGGPFSPHDEALFSVRTPHSTFRRSEVNLGGDKLKDKGNFKTTLGHGAILHHPSNSFSNSLSTSLCGGENPNS